MLTWIVIHFLRWPGRWHILLPLGHNQAAAVDIKITTIAKEVLRSQMYDNKTRENSGTPGVMEPGMHTNTPNPWERSRKNSGSTPSTSSVSTNTSDSIVRVIVRVLQDFGNLAKKQLESCTVQQQVIEQQRVFAVEPPKAAIESDSVSALRERFCYKKKWRQHNPVQFALAFVSKSYARGEELSEGNPRNKPET